MKKGPFNPFLALEKKEMSNEPEKIEIKMKPQKIEISKEPILKKVDEKLEPTVEITNIDITPSVKENETNSFSFTDKSPTERNSGDALCPNFLSVRCNKYYFEISRFYNIN